MSKSMPKVCRTDTLISGAPSGSDPGVAIWLFALIEFFQRLRELQSLSRGDAALQGRIGLIDDLETLFRCLVTPVLVRVMTLHQLLVARLDPLERDRAAELENGQGLVLGRAALGRALLRARLLAAVFPEDAEEVAPFPGIEPQALRHPRPERPARPLPNGVAPAKVLDLALAHAGVIIPPAIVIADMRQAEPVIFPEPITALGSSIQALVLAIRVIAAPQLGPVFGGPGIQPDMRRSLHEPSMGCRGLPSKPRRRRGFTPLGPLAGLPTT